MGLPCRAPGVECREAFAPVRGDSTEALRDAAIARDDHELGQHGYVHITPSILVADQKVKKREWSSYAFNQPFSGGYTGFTNTPAARQRADQHMLIRQAEIGAKVG